MQIFYRNANFQDVHKKAEIWVKKAGVLTDAVKVVTPLVWYFCLVVRLSFCRCGLSGHTAFLFQGFVAL